MRDSESIDKKDFPPESPEDSVNVKDEETLAHTLEKSKDARKTKRLDIVWALLRWVLTIFAGVVLIKSIFLFLGMESNDFFFATTITVLFGTITTLIGVIAGSSID